ncbi:MAG: pcm [Chloroflexi bacterium]|nr:pcm [Chloroflexota bacterium]
MSEESSYYAVRQRMVEEQLLERDIRDARVLQAMRDVPRHRFVQPEHATYAYADGPLPIGLGQTISQPYIVALMTQLLRLTGKEKVLEIGTGSGYQAAVLASLAREVHTVERYPELANRATRILAELGYNNITVHIGDGSLGLPGLAPFDAIMVTAAAPRAPQALLDQLEPTGKLVIPVGGRGAQYLEVWEKQADEWNCETVLPVAFVPLVGQFGWKE